MIYLESFTSSFAPHSLFVHSLFYHLVIPAISQFQTERWLVFFGIQQNHNITPAVAKALLIQNCEIIPYLSESIDLYFVISSYL